MREMMREGQIMRRMMCVMVVGVVLTGQSVRSQEVGKNLPGPFRVFVVTGEMPKASPEGLLPSERQNHGDLGRVGKYHDFVTRFGLDPTIAVITRQPPPAADQPLGKLIQALDQAVDKNKLAKLHGWVAFLGIKDDYLKDESRSAQIKAIDAFAKSLNLKNVPLAIALQDSQETRTYNIAPDTVVTVIAYANHKMTGRWDFTTDKPLDDAAIDTLKAEIAKLVAPKK
jgi:hypothetical protein